ncbi:hypothetical protein JL2886_00589 [Phaeobacter gallaeciensis]|uniref:Uncharacterized protein n=1 Tax=Phaeobacter gallaeciensis TaxID=60890 RepID=A0A1B0ZMW7_9RHOB|nr:hypothetical protein JL2886_00589 [Phaeobacter gallaeciensis]
MRRASTYCAPRSPKSKSGTPRNLCTDSATTLPRFTQVQWVQGPRRLVAKLSP